MPIDGIDKREDRRDFGPRRSFRFWVIALILKIALSFYLQ